MTWDWGVQMFVVEFDRRSDDGPRLVGPFATKDAGNRWATDEGKRVMARDGNWDCSYCVVPLYVPPAGH
jgi:hypothetical protein